MAIIKKYPETLDAKTTYDLLKSPTIKKLSEAAGQILGIHAFVLHDEIDGNGEVRSILNIQDETGEVYATNSATFVREFMGILDCMESPADLNHIEVLRLMSKNNRPYLTARWVD